MNIFEQVKPDVADNIGKELAEALWLVEGGQFGFTTDIPKGMYMLESMAKQGNAKAMFHLGFIYCTGRALPTDYKKAFAYFQRSAELGDAEAMDWLSNCYWEGWGTNIDKRKSFEWAKKSAERGNEEGQFHLAYCYDMGIDGYMPPDKEAAMYWYKKAAENGHPQALEYLKMLEAESINSDMSFDKAYKKAEQLYFDKKYDECQNYIQAFKYNAKMQYLQGEILLKQKTEPDNIVAFELFQKAAERDCVEAKHQLAYCLENGIGTEINLQRAYNLYKECAEREYPQGICSLGRCYYEGFIVDRDIPKALALFERSANLGYKTSYFYIGVCYENGVGVEKDKSKAVGYYRKAYEAQDSEEAEAALSRLGISVMASWRPDETNIEKLQARIATGDAKAMADYGTILITGKFGAKKDVPKAIEWFKKSEERGCVKGLLGLAACYSDGIGVECNKARAFGLYKKGADEYNDAWCMHEVATRYQNGSGVMRNLKLAKQYYKRAAEYGIQEAALGYNAIIAYEKMTKYMGMKI